MSERPSGLPEQDDEPIFPPRQVTTPSDERFPPLVIPEAQASATAPVRQGGRGRGCLPNLLTVLFLLATIALIVYFGLLWRQPDHPLNPLPPYTRVPIIITTTPLPPTETPPPTATDLPPTATFTPLPVTPPSVTPTYTPAPFAFTLAEPGIDYDTSAHGCNWVGIGGTVVDLEGEALVGYQVVIRSQETSFETQAETGSAPGIGAGGFEAAVGETPVLSPYTVQLLTAEGTPASEEYLVVTSDSCEQNLVVVNFVQNR